MELNKLNTKGLCSLKSVCPSILSSIHRHVSVCPWPWHKRGTFGDECWSASHNWNHGGYQPHGASSFRGLPAQPQLPVLGPHAERRLLAIAGCCPRPRAPFPESWCGGAEDSTKSRPLAKQQVAHSKVLGTGEDGAAWPQWGRCVSGRAHGCACVCAIVCTHVHPGPLSPGVTKLTTSGV